MSANTIITSTVTGGTNSHTTVAEEANAIATDFVTQGVVGAITLNTGSGGTGSFCVNADATADMGVTIKAGQAYITATPSSQDSQVLRARASSDYTSYTINANSSGSTKYDWIYLKVDATKANSPASDASDVTSVYTSRSSSNTTDNGTPPTYGLLLAVVTVANGASSITNSNITDKRYNTSIGAQNGSLIVTQQATGDDAIVQAAGSDANINVQLAPKGTGVVNIEENGSSVSTLAASGSDTNIDVDINAKGTGSVKPNDLTLPAGKTKGQIRQRQGGDATNWATNGTTNYDVSSTNTLTQCGVIRTSTSADTIVTFEKAFSGTPIVIATSVVVGGSSFARLGATPTTTTFQVSTLTSSGSRSADDCHWIAVGPA